MAQAFITVSQKTYVWHDYRFRTETKKPPEAIYNEPPKADIWLPDVESGGQCFTNATVEEMKKFVDRLYRRRNWTTYQVCYCKKQFLKANKGNDEDVELAENELIAYGKRIYSEPTQKIIKPLPTSRKLFGYMRPRNMYTGLTKYQDFHGKLGYDILLKDHLYCKAHPELF